MNTPLMPKTVALSVFEGLPGTARSIGISKQAVRKWPEQLPATISDRVVAAALRTNRLHRLPAEFRAIQQAA